MTKELQSIDASSKPKPPPPPGGVCFTTQEARKDLFKRLSEPFPPEAIERTKGSVTRKGYDTTGIKYQYIVNRFNEVLGVGGFMAEPTITVRETKTQKGRAMFDAVCDLTLKLGEWSHQSEDGISFRGFIPFAEACGTGGHSSLTEADAKKGAFTNAFKKVAAMFGCGWQAYAGTLDDDSEPPGYDEDDARAAYENGRRNQRPQQNQRTKPVTSDEVLAKIYNAKSARDLESIKHLCEKLPEHEKANVRGIFKGRWNEFARPANQTTVGHHDDGPQERPRRREPGDDDGPIPGDPRYGTVVHDEDWNHKTPQSY